MTTALRRIRATMLTQLAAGAIIDAGAGQGTDPYPRRMAQAIGPMVGALRRAGIIAYAGADHASRPTRRRTVARLWRAVDREACRALAAADLIWLTEHPDHPESGPAGERQLLLWEVP